MAEKLELKDPKEVFEQLNHDIENPPTPQEVAREIFPTPPEDPKAIPGDLFTRGNEILFESRQRCLLDAVTADVSDAIIGIVPGLDLLGITRVSDSLAQKGKDKQIRTAVMAFDTVIGIVPGIGDILDFLHPANTISFAGSKVTDKVIE